ncbi:LysR family transcriptional regulator [Thaumasiovibrio subtropicus]|uniref:LysR family transcriptional regulator n=1 Tax=Thaumasiovibrio subtropicus TaxID=1891207 RepID=UPI000B34C5B2|nr:LysR family transcriptional regulator [Thaumasiovibrio subtropicus]
MRKHPPLKSLYAFVAVAETGSMTAAAQALSVSHSAISQAIKSLETQLSCNLFVREGRSVRLSNEGKRYYKQVGPALETIVHATEELMAGDASHQLTLNMVNSLVLHWWLPRVDNFQTALPKIDVRISNLTGHINLAAQHIDVALIHGQPEDWKNETIEFLADDTLVLVHRPDVAGQSVQQLLDTLPPIYITNPRRQNDWRTWCKHHHVPLPKQHNTLTFDATIQGLQAVTLGLGILVTHYHFIQNDVEAGLLAFSGDPVSNEDFGYYLAVNPHRADNENVLATRHWLKQAFIPAF